MGVEGECGEEGSCVGENGNEKARRKAKQEWRWGRSWGGEPKKGDEGGYEGW